MGKPGGSVLLKDTAHLLCYDHECPLIHGIVMILPFTALLFPDNYIYSMVMKLKTKNVFTVCSFYTVIPG